MPHQKQRLAPQVRLRISRHRKQVDVGGMQAGGVEAGRGGVLRKPGAVLDPAVALLLDCHHEAAIDDQCGRNVAVVGVQPEDIHALTAVASDNCSMNRRAKWRAWKSAATRAAAAAPIRRRSGASSNSVTIAATSAPGD